MTALATINPFYAARQQQAARSPGATAGPAATAGRYAKLPQAPINGSPVPHLTSLYHFSRAGSTATGAIPATAAATSSKTCCCISSPPACSTRSTAPAPHRRLPRAGIPCTHLDIRFGQDACSPSSYPQTGKYDFVWSHPPYWRQKIYTNDPRDLSQQPTLAAFLERYRRFIECCAGVLADGGKFAILMGDYSDREAGFVPLVYWTKHLAFQAGLRQHCTDIIRFSHGASSGKKVYRSSFIPGLHDVA